VRLRKAIEALRPRTPGNGWAGPEFHDGGRTARDGSHEGKALIAGAVDSAQRALIHPTKVHELRINI